MQSPDTAAHMQSRSSCWQSLITFDCLNWAVVHRLVDHLNWQFNILKGLWQALKHINLVYIRPLR